MKLKYTKHEEAKRQKRKERENKNTRFVNGRVNLGIGQRKQMLYLPSSR